MDRARLATALLGLAVGLLASVAAWLAFDTLVLFLFLPFVPFLFGRGSKGESDGPAGPARRPVHRCPRCGFQSRRPAYDYCPRDGTRLERVDGS